MHLIGPRPCLPGQYQVLKRRRLNGVAEAVPGLTGWAQVNGVDMSSPGQLASYDAQYLGFRSILWDIKILRRTFWPNRVTD
jgi:lipopolysaccharide/colanic/teichoic acid biosynthesis glycosyltransferase